MFKTCKNLLCIHNGELQPITNFFKNKRNKDGFDGYCKTCVKKRHDEYRKKNLEAYREAVRLSYYKKKNYYQKKHKEFHDNNKEKTREKLNELAKYDKWVEIFSKYKEEIILKDPKNPNLVLTQCKYCGNSLNPTNAQLVSRLQAIRQSDTNRYRNNFIYCSESCKMACPVFGKHEDLNNIIEKKPSHEVSASFRKIVLEEDNWTCQICGKSKINDNELELHVHHEKGYKLNPIFREDIDNCFTVCKICHLSIHKKDGCKYH